MCDVLYQTEETDHICNVSDKSWDVDLRLVKQEFLCVVSPKNRLFLLVFCIPPVLLFLTATMVMLPVSFNANK